MGNSINITINQNGGSNVIKTIDDIGRSSNTSATSVNVLKQALGVLGTTATVGGLVSMLDTLQTARNRLQYVSRSTDEVNVAMNKLFEISEKTRSEFELNAQLYQQIVIGAQNMTISHADAARAVQTLQEAMTLSGASGTKATEALTYFTKALNVGTLNSRELRSTIRQLPAVIDIFADRLNVQRGAIQRLGTEGKLTAQEMVQALLGASDKIDTQFSKISATGGQAFEVLKTKTLQFLDGLDQKFHILEKLTQALDILGQHMTILATVVIAGLLTVTIVTLVTALGILAGALATPLGMVAAIVSVVATAVLAMLAFASSIQVSADGTVTLGDYLTVMWNILKEGAQEAYVALKAVVSVMTTELRYVFSEVLGSLGIHSLEDLFGAIAKFADIALGTLIGFGKAVVLVWNNIPATILLVIEKTFNEITQFIQDDVNAVIHGINKLSSVSILGHQFGASAIADLKLAKIPIVGAAKDIADGIKSALLGGSSNVDGFFEKAFAGLSLMARKAAEARQKANTGQSDFNAPNVPKGGQSLQDVDTADKLASINEEIVQLQKVSVERRTALDLEKFINEEKRKGVNIDESHANSVAGALRGLEVQKEISKVTQEVSGSYEDQGIQIDALTSLVDKHVEHLDAYIQKLDELREQQLLSSKGLTEGFEAGFLKTKDTISDFASQGEKVVTNMFDGMSSALTSFVVKGKADWGSLAESILQDLLKIALNKLVVGLIGSIGGGLGGAAAGAAGNVWGSDAVGAGFGGARASGGPVSPNSAYLVGEHGPEIFRPSGSGNIVPNHMMGGGSEVHVHVVNVSDPQEIAAALNHPANQDVVVNVIRKNKGAVKSALGL